MSYWAIVPASGIGARMGNELPKQYLDLLGKTVIEHTVERLLLFEKFTKIVVVVSEVDSHWHTLSLSKNENILTVSGGKQRFQSVYNGLINLQKNAQDNDWVLVHDAVRPCIHSDDLNQLIDLTKKCDDEFIGAVLGDSIHDTIKKANSSHQIQNTVSRDQLWAAFTPQIFPYKYLFQSMKTAVEQGKFITDESSAMENAGFKPLMVQGRKDNIKITRPYDLLLAQSYLQLQKKERNS